MFFLDTISLYQLRIDEAPKPNVHYIKNIKFTFIIIIKKKKRNIERDFLPEQQQAVQSKTTYKPSWL